MSFTRNLNAPAPTGSVVTLATLTLAVFSLAAMQPATAMAQAQADTSLSFFITSVGLGKGANLGGLSGADAQCEKLAEAVGAGNRVWRAYLSTQATTGASAVSARDRIGTGPWHNAKGVRVALNVADLHSANNTLGKANSLSEKGDPIKGRGDSPNQHDILTGSKADGTAHPAGTDLTCANWTSETTGSAMLGHHDRQGIASNIDPASWNQAHASSGCSQANLVGTGGNGLFYCFASDAATGLRDAGAESRLAGFTFLGQGGAARFALGDGQEAPVYSLSLRERRAVRVSILTLSGRTLAEPVSGLLDAGQHEIHWNGRDKQGNAVPRGFYLIAVTTGPALR